MREIQALIGELACGDAVRAEAAAHEVSKFGEAALRPLLDLRRSEDPEGRWWATRALALFDGHVSEQAILESLEDPDPAVRYCAAVALRHVPSVLAIPSLLEAMASQDPLLSRLASDALAALGRPALNPLQQAAQSLHVATRLGAVRALSRMADSDAVPTLFEALDDPSPLVHFWAQDGLNRLGVGMVFFEP